MGERGRRWRRGGVKVYVAAWQLLRVGAAFLLLLFYLPFLIAGYFGAYSPEGVSETVQVEQRGDPEVVCGILSATTIELPRKYVVFWPEYEGKSSWEKGFASNKKGCGAKLVSLYISTSWPDFQPLSVLEAAAWGEKFPGLEITMTPIDRETDDMRFFLDGFLESEAHFENNYKSKQYDESLGLFFVDSNDSVIPEVMNRYYWSEVDAAIPIVFECKRTRKGSIYICYGYFVLKEFDYFIELRFSPEKLLAWREVIKKTIYFIVLNVNK